MKRVNDTWEEPLDVQPAAAEKHHPSTSREQNCIDILTISVKHICWTRVSKPPLKNQCFFFFYYYYLFQITLQPTRVQVKEVKTVTFGFWKHVQMCYLRLRYKNMWITEWAVSQICSWETCGGLGRPSNTSPNLSREINMRRQCSQGCQIRFWNEKEKKKKNDIRARNVFTEARISDRKRRITKVLEEVFIHLNLPN